MVAALCKGLLAQGTPASQGTFVFFEHFPHLWGGGNTTGLQSLQLCRTLDIQETLRNTPGCIYLCFSTRKHTPDMFCAPVHTPVTSSLQKWCHLVVGHTLKYIVSKNEVNRTDGSRDIDIFVSPLSFHILFPLSANTPETWQNRHQHHNSSYPSLPRPQQMPLLVHWQLGQPP